MHQCEPRKMVYYGNVLCDQHPDRYMNIVRYLFAEYKKEAPLIINTMGWFKGQKPYNTIEYRWLSVIWPF